MVVIDNFLPNDIWDEFKNGYIADIFRGYLPLYFVGAVANINNISDNNYYFEHNIFRKHEVVSNELYSYIIAKIAPLLDVKSFIRIKLNAYPRMDNIIEHDSHIDYDFEHKGALLYLNTCNGFTRLEDDNKVDSVENRMMFFDPSKEHNSSTSTDEKLRLTINFNYF